jgi:FkbM family methyltransferase
MIKKIIQKAFNMVGLQISKRQPVAAVVYDYQEQMKVGLSRFKKLDIPVNTIVDVGAAQGHWSLMARQFWPEATYVLFEPLTERRRELEHLAKTTANFHFIPAAAGKEKGTVHFIIADDLDGSGIASDIDNPKVRAVDVVSIHEQIKKRNISGPYLIKLDTHGFELPILEGCAQILPEVSMFIIECYGFQIANGSLLLHEMCRHMESLGFRLYNIADVMHRAKDGAFWQCDAFFIRSDNPLFKDNQYA